MPPSSSADPNRFDFVAWNHDERAVIDIVWGRRSVAMFALEGDVPTGFAHDILVAAVETILEGSGCVTLKTESGWTVSRVVRHA